MQRAAIDIIGDGWIPQNEKWIEKLSEFIKYVYEEHKHIKLIGCQFGSLLIAYALGGKVREKPPQTDAQQQFIGKEEINLRPQFFEQTWVRQVVEYTELDDHYQEELSKIGVMKVNNESVSELPAGS